MYNHVTNRGIRRRGSTHLPTGKRWQGAGDADSELTRPSGHRSAMCTAVHDRADSTADSLRDGLHNHGRHRLFPARLVCGVLILLASLGAVNRALALNDPTRPPAGNPAAQAPGQPAAATGELVLSAILVAPERRVAVINGQPLQIGEQLGHIRVEAIHLDRVTIKHGKRLLTLTLKSGVVKKTATLPAKGP